jgi:hypothetical protein
MTLLKVTGPGGVLIYEGEGDIVMSHDPAGLVGPAGASRMLLRTEPDGGPNRDVAVPDDANPFWTVHYDLSGERPLTLRWEIELTLSLSKVAEMRRAVGLPDPYGDVVHNLAANGVMSEDEARASLDMVLQAPEPGPQPVQDNRSWRERFGLDGAGEMTVGDAWAAHRRSQTQLEFYRELLRDSITAAEDLPRNLLGLDGAGELARPDGEPRPVPEYDELIAQTRAEFPYDPHNYGHPQFNEMSWSPPADGEKVPSCPA